LRNRLRSGEGTDDDAEDVRIHRSHLLADHGATGIAIVGIFGLSDRHHVSGEANPLHPLRLAERLRRQQSARAGGDGPGEVVGQRVPGLGRPVRGLRGFRGLVGLEGPQRLQRLRGQPGHLLRGDPADQHLLAGETAVDRAHADPGPPGHLLHRRTVAEFPEDLAGGTEHTLQIAPGIDPQAAARPGTQARTRIRIPHVSPLSVPLLRNRPLRSMRKRMFPLNHVVRPPPVGTPFDAMPPDPHTMQ